jgi:hypothetical protein
MEYGTIRKIARVEEASVDCALELPGAPARSFLVIIAARRTGITI